MMASSNASKKVKDWGSGEERCCIICWKNESPGSTSTGGIEVPCNFLDTLNLVWPCLGEEKTNGDAEIESKTGYQGGGDYLHGGGRFTEVPPICQVCTDRIQSVQYFKGLSERYLDELRKSLKETKTEAYGCGPSSLFLSKLKGSKIPRTSVETQQKPDIPLATLNLPWRRNFVPSTPSSLQGHPVSMEIQQIVRTVRGILNKLTNNGSNFNGLTSQLVAILPFLKGEDSHPNNQLIIETVASLIFNKAVKEPFYCPVYVSFIHVISKISKQFKKSILDVCQSEFQQVCVKAEESSSGEGEEENEDKRRRCFGIVNFIQQLFNSKLVKPNIIVYCLEGLLEPPVHQLKLECVHSFLAAEKHDDERTPFGQLIDVQLKAIMDTVKAGRNVKYLPKNGRMDKIFEKLTNFSKNPNFSGRIRCLLENLVELHGNGWKKQEKSWEIAMKSTEVPRGKTVLKLNRPEEEPALTLWLFERKCRETLNKVELNGVDSKNDNLYSQLFYDFFKSPLWFREGEKMDQQICTTAEMIFEKAIKEPMLGNAYAKMVRDIGKFRKRKSYKINFQKIREIVVNQCIEEIGKISGDAHADVVEAEKKFGERERILGVIKFIEELYRLEEFSARNMGTCLKLLIGEGGEGVSELRVECVYKLLLCKFMNRETNEMVYYGQFLDKQSSVVGASGEGDDEDVRWIEGMFGDLKTFSEDLRFGGRVRCLLMNLMELRGNRWKHESKAVASMAELKEDRGKKNGEGGGNKKGQIPDGNWRIKRCAANF